MEKIIGVDLDEVLSETINDVLKHNNYMFKGIPVTRKDITDYYLWNLPKYNATVEEGVDFFQGASSIFLDFKPVVGAKTALRVLKKQGWKIIIVTARKDDIRDVTMQWLNKHFAGLFDEVIFANHFTEKSKEKSDICKEAGIKIMIEDNLHYAVKLAQKGIKVYLLDKPWNTWYDPKIHKGIIKVKRWKEIEL